MEELPVIIEEPESIVEPTPKKRGRPNGSKNKAPDLYTQLMEKMTQIEETFKNQSSTGGTPEAPKKRVAMTRIRPKPPITIEPTAADQYMESFQQTQDLKRQKQLDFYASFM